MKTYTTVQGDMWDSIAYAQMGSVLYTDKLMWANQAYLDFYIFPSGIELTIPDIPTEWNNAALPPWKQVMG